MSVVTQVASIVQYQVFLKTQKLLQKLNCLLTVQPSITILEVDKTPIWKGSTFNLACSVEGYPPPENPTLQKGQTKMAFNSCDSGTNKKLCSKTVINVEYGDTDVYKCSTKNTISGTDKPSSDTVKVIISKFNLQHVEFCKIIHCLGAVECGGCDYGECDYGECDYSGCVSVTVRVRVRAWVRVWVGVWVRVWVRVWIKVWVRVWVRLWLGYGFWCGLGLVLGSHSP